MIEQNIKLYEGINLSTAVDNVIYLPVLKDGTITRLDVKVGAANGAGDTIFNLKLNGTDQFSGGARPKVVSGATLGSKESLSIAVVVGDVLQLDLESVPTGGVTAPITLNVEINDGVSSGGGSSLSEDTATYTTASIANNATETGTVELGKSFLLTKIAADVGSRVRVYRTPAYRTADAARAIGTDPTGEHGVILDVVLTSGNLTLDLSPIVSGATAESPRDENIAIAVENRSGSTDTVTITFTKITLEA